MNINNKITKVLNSPLLASSIFLVSGLGNTYSDYKKADEKYKKNFLIKDTVVLGGAMTGMLLSGNIHLLTKNLKPVKNIIDKCANKIKDKINTDKFHNNVFDNKYVQNSFNFAKEIINNTLLNCSMFTFGIIGAVTADSLLAKLNFEQPNKNFHHNKNGLDKFVDKQVNKYVKKEDKKILYSRLYDMPQLSMFAPSVIGEESLKISREKNMNKKLKRTTSSLINNSLIPMFLLSASTIVTHNMNSWIRIPTIFLSLVGGTKVINLLRKNYLDKKDEKIESTNIKEKT